MCTLPCAILWCSQLKCNRCCLPRKIDQKIKKEKKKSMCIYGESFIKGHKEIILKIALPEKYKFLVSSFIHMLALHL